MIAILRETFSLQNELNTPEGSDFDAYWNMCRMFWADESGRAVNMSTAFAGFSARFFNYSELALNTLTGQHFDRWYLATKPIYREQMDLMKGLSKQFTEGHITNAQYDMVGDHAWSLYNVKLALFFVLFLEEQEGERRKGLQWDREVMQRTEDRLPEWVKEIRRGQTQ
jgi:hypothetical protein